LLLEWVLQGAAIGRDANNNMHPIFIAVVEAKIKDNWTWFLEALLMADLGPKLSTLVDFYFR
jgi:hypothetical protein